LPDLDPTLEESQALRPLMGCYQRTLQLHWRDLDGSSTEINELAGTKSMFTRLPPDQPPNGVEMSGFVRSIELLDGRFLSIYRSVTPLNKRLCQFGFGPYQTASGSLFWTTATTNRSAPTVPDEGTFLN
jgi:hypothetical protein